MASRTRLNKQAEYQANFNIIQNRKNILVQLTLSAITDKGTSFQRIYSMSANQEINELNAINAEFIGNLKNDKE